MSANVLETSNQIPSVCVHTAELTASVSALCGYPQSL